jgi:hypothetical protein
MADLPLYLLFLALLIVLPFLYLRPSFDAPKSQRRQAPPVAVGAPGDRPHPPPRGRAPAPRDARPGPAPRPAYAAPPGRAPCVIASSANAEREIMLTHDASFASRPIGQGPPRRRQLRSRVRALRRRVATAPLLAHRIKLVAELKENSSG